MSENHNIPLCDPTTLKKAVGWGTRLAPRQGGERFMFLNEKNNGKREQKKSIWSCLFRQFISIAAKKALSLIVNMTLEAVVSGEAWEALGELWELIQSLL